MLLEPWSRHKFNKPVEKPIPHRRVQSADRANCAAENGQTGEDASHGGLSLRKVFD